MEGFAVYASGAATPAWAVAFPPQEERILALAAPDLQSPVNSYAKARATHARLLAWLLFFCILLRGWAPQSPVCSYAKTRATHVRINPRLLTFCTFLRGKTRDF